MSAVLRYGPGVIADPDVDQPTWGGRKAQQYVRLCLAEYGSLCWLCGLPGADTADHVIPRSLGGAVYDLANLAPAHRRCNEARGNRSPGTPQTVVESGLDYFRPNPDDLVTPQKTKVRIA